MMEYTGKFWYMNSKTLGEEVGILEYKSDNKFPYCECDMCGKDIKRHMFEVQSKETGIILMSLGADCIKKLS